MRILMRRNTIVAGEHRSIGDVVEVDDRIGEALIFMKKAVVAPESDEAKDETGGNTDETGDESGVEAAVVGPEEQAVQPKAKRKA